jgi:acyl carrier protein
MHRRRDMGARNAGNLLMSLFEQVRKIIAEETGSNESWITESTTLDSLGVDSLEFVSLMQAIGAIKSIPESRYYALNTVGDILEALV